jgi:hypothetical protein
MLVDVTTTEGVYLAKVVSKNKTTLTVRYLVYKRKGVYDYEDTDEIIDKECVSGEYDPDATEEDAGFIRLKGGGFVQKDGDDDYEPSESESDDDTVSLVGEEEELV